MRAHTHTDIFIHTRHQHTCMHAYTHTHLHTYTLTHSHTHPYIHTHTHTHKHTYIHLQHVMSMYVGADRIVLGTEDGSIQVWSVWGRQLVAAVPRHKGVFVCVYIYICICMYVCMCVHLNFHLHLHIHTHTRKYIRTYMYT